MSADKNYCMSSYLAFRYIADSDKDFDSTLHHLKFRDIPNDKKVFVNTAEEIDAAIRDTFVEQKNEKLGLMLSGGMDSAILASYMSGCDAYTFRFLGGTFQKDELNRAKKFSGCYGLNLHYVDIDWDRIERNIDTLMLTKGAPVHSIEPQLFLAASQAKADGITTLVIGNASDYVFGGMDKLLSKDWLFDDFIKRYTYIDPFEILNEAVNVNEIFEKYRVEDRIDFIRFMEDVAIEESYGSYLNAFTTAKMPYIDPYMKLKMARPLDLRRIRNGESKYLIRKLFKLKYPNFDIPEKNPMPRPVDKYFENWNGPSRPEFLIDLDMSKFTGNQKWQLWCLERFLNLLDSDMWTIERN